MTTVDMVDGLIKFTMAVLGPIAGGCIWFFTFQSNRTERFKITHQNEVQLRRMEIDREIAIAKENSAGAVAVAKLVEEDKKIIEEMHRMEEKLEGADEETRAWVQRIGNQVQEFTLTAVSLLTGNIKK